MYNKIYLYKIGEIMKRKNLQNFFKGRKTLMIFLCLVMISVFTLTIAYAALNAVLTISGSAQVTSADWDIHLANPKVTSGSVNTDVPTISGNTLSFNTTLTTPGDFYEFTVDVVNDGSIDAMINNVTKNPELTVEQAKYLKYEITYQNGESITAKQLLSKNTSMPIKVRIEYRNDLDARDLPTTSTTLNLSLTLEYIQSDGIGTSINNNGVGGSIILASGDINEIGTIVTIGDQQFYTIGTEGDNVKLLSMYNLYVGNKHDYDNGVFPLASPTGKQSELAKGWIDGATEFYGTTAFSNTNSTYVGSIVEGYINNYKTILESDYGVDVVEARLISYDELTDSETFACGAYDFCSDKYPWIYSTSYWSGSADSTNYVWYVSSIGCFDTDSYNYDGDFGVRPVIVISKDYFN